MSVDITGTDETEQAACWDQLIGCIAECLKIKLRPWKEKDFQEFETALLSLAAEKIQVIATAG